MKLLCNSCGLVAVAVAAAIFEALVVASFVAVQILLPGFATEFGLGIVTVLIGAAVVSTVVETVFIAVLVAHFPVLADAGRFLLLRGLLFGFGLAFLFALGLFLWPLW